jgi:hypothetical protein
MGLTLVQNCLDFGGTSVAAATELGRWVYGGGMVLPGLVARRAEEVSLLRGLFGEPYRK